MRTYELKKAPGLPLYEGLYRCLRRDIQAGILAPGEKLPSKRALATHLKVSKITVETAYNQLLSQGYITARERQGYFVENVTHAPPPAALPMTEETREEIAVLDLTGNGPAHFPFQLWSKLQRRVLLDYGEKLLQPMENQGCAALRCAIADHLAGFRGMAVKPENIIIGAGADFLYNLLIQLLGRERLYAVEEPGYGKIRKIYTAGGVECVSAPLDDTGVMPQLPPGTGVLHCSPSHHFPTGLVTPLKRRQELLSWAREQGGYIIEDDYDSEFRFHAHPLPALYSLDGSGRVIYMNSFSKSLTPAIRISYMVLPDGLMKKYRETLNFYSGTVASFEQYTLAAFLAEGYFEKHINRMRRFYKLRRDKVIAALGACPWKDKITVQEQDAGLHFLLQTETELDDDRLTALWESCGIRVRSLGSYYRGNVPDWARGVLVINYSGLDEQQLWRLDTLPEPV